MNVLLLGSDNRGDARAAEAQAAAGTPADQRSDMIMLVHIPADRQKIYGISIPRDLWVDIPGYGQSKINAALGLGGMPLVAKTVGSLFNTHIDHTAMLDFEGFKTITDGLGGIDVDVTFPFTSTHDSRHDFPAGINHLNGAEALEFVRERYAFSDGDFQRIRNQQTFLKAVIGKFMSASTLTSPATVRNVVNAVRPYLIVDQGLDAETLVHLAFSLRNVKPQDAVLFRVPTAGFGVSTDGQSIVLQDPAAISALATALAEGKLTDYVAANGFENGN
jgi:LCP family protein required for cell wall assembly